VFYFSVTPETSFFGGDSDAIAEALTVEVEASGPERRSHTRRLRLHERRPAGRTRTRDVSLKKINTI